MTNATTPADILRALCCMVLGASLYLGGVCIKRTSLFGFEANGTRLTLEDAGEEVAYLVAEREAARMEPSILRAAEVASRHMGMRGVEGDYRVRGGAVRFYPTWGSTQRLDAAALTELAGWADYFGVPVELVGNEVRLVGPALRKTAPQASARRTA